MKKLLVVLLALALPVAADGPVVCSETPQSPGTSCSAAVQSSTNCVCVAAEAGSAEPSVYDDAVSLWRLDEASGTRADSIGSNDLTDNNTVGYVNLGPQGTVASFVTANTESLSVDPGPTPTVVSISAWVNCSSSSAGDQYGQVFSLKDGLLFLATGKQDSGNLFFAVEEYSSAWYGTMTAKGWTASSTYNTWNHLLAEISDDAHTITLYLNGALWVGPIAYSNSWGTGVAATKGVIGPKGMVYTGSVIGPSTAGFNPKIARTGVWSRVLTAEERTSLYNSGLGKSYSDLTTAEKVGLVSYWNLDEASGNRADSHGSNTLTDNNTVGSATNSYPANLPGRVASFVEGNSEYLSRANADLTNWPQGDFHFAVWATRTGTDADFEENYASKLISTGDQREWRIHTAIGQDRLYLAASSDGTSEDAGANTGAGSFPVNTWHLLELRRSGTTIGVAIDGGAFADASVSGVFNGTAAFVLGARNSGTFGYHDGMLSTAALWPRVLTPDERAALYNSGDGAVLP